MISFSFFIHSFIHSLIHSFIVIIHHTHFSVICKFTSQSAAVCLRDSLLQRLVFHGDSHSRNRFAMLLRLLGLSSDSVPARGHQRFEHTFHALAGSADSSLVVEQRWAGALPPRLRIAEERPTQPPLPADVWPLPPLDDPTLAYVFNTGHWQLAYRTAAELRAHIDSLSQFLAQRHPPAKATVLFEDSLPVDAPVKDARSNARISHANDYAHAAFGGASDAAMLLATHQMASSRVDTVIDGKYHYANVTSSPAVGPVVATELHLMLAHLCAPSSIQRRQHMLPAATDAKSERISASTPPVAEQSSAASTPDASSETLTRPRPLLSVISFIATALFALYWLSLELHIFPTSPWPLSLLASLNASPPADGSLKLGEGEVASTRGAAEKFSATAFARCLLCLMLVACACAVLDSPTGDLFVAGTCLGHSLAVFFYSFYFSFFFLFLSFCSFSPV